MPVYTLKTPLSKEEVRKLKISDIIYLDGTIVAMRDLAHRRYVENARQGKFIPIDLEGLAIYHCGPLVKRIAKKWVVVSAGPTTSMRMEKFMPEILKLSGARLIIGKGGIGSPTIAALKDCGAAYCDFTGGAGVLAAEAIKDVIDVKWLDLGLPEAVWVLKVEKFGPLLVTVDSEGNNLRKI